MVVVAGGPMTSDPTDPSPDPGGSDAGGGPMLALLARGLDCLKRQTHGSGLGQVLIDNVSDAQDTRYPPQRTDSRMNTGRLGAVDSAFPRMPSPASPKFFLQIFPAK